MEEVNIIDTIQTRLGIEYSKEQRDILEHKKGMVILASAGSGKTTVLTHLIAKRILNKEIINASKLLCTTYSKAGAEELEERLEKVFKKLGLKNYITVKTLHAVYLQVLRDFGIGAKIIDNARRMRYLREAVKAVGVKLDGDNILVLDTLLSYQVNNLLSDEALYNSYVYTIDNEVSLKEFTAIRQYYNNKKSSEGYIDFDDMQLYMYALLVKSPRQDVIDYCNERWEYHYIDEAQDVSRIQFEIMRAMVKDGDKLVMIGDDDQSIYQWRGADPSVILNIYGYYDVSKFILSTNYRCGNNIVQIARKGIENNTERESKLMVGYRDGGEFKILDSGGGDLYNQSIRCAEYVRSLIVDKVENPKDIAILVRNNYHATIVNNMLFREGIYSSVSEEIKFSSSPIYKDIKVILELFSNGKDFNITSTHLWKLVRYLGIAGARTIGELQSQCNLRLSDVLKIVLGIIDRKRFDSLDTSSILGIEVPYQLKGKINYTICRNLAYDKREELLSSIVKLIHVLEDRCNFNDMLQLYHSASSFMYKSEDSYRMFKGIIRYLGDLYKGLGENDLLEYLKVVEHFEAGKLEVMGDKITIGTMHGAKGKEWKNVVIFLCDNESIPNMSILNNLIDKGVRSKDILASLEENRRLHYVAITRARENAVIVADKNDLSTYTLECLDVLNFTDLGVDANKLIIDMARYSNFREKVIKDSIEKAGEFIG